MNIWENAVITMKGLALQAKLIAGNTLSITKVVIGSGYVDPETLRTQTGVTEPQKTLTKVASIQYPEDGKCAIKIKIDNTDVETQYTARQVGFYATDPDEGEILYFLAQAEEGSGTTVPSDAEMYNYSAEWTFYFQYGQADNVTVVVDPANSVSQAELESYVDQAMTWYSEIEENPFTSGTIIDWAKTKTKDTTKIINNSFFPTDAPTQAPAVVEVIGNPDQRIVRVTPFNTTDRSIYVRPVTADGTWGSTTWSPMGAVAQEVADDLHAIDTCTIVQCFEGTLNTPYKEGLTNAAHGMCIVSATGNFRSLVYIATSSERAIYYQTCVDGTWYPWTTTSIVGRFPSNTIYIGPTGNDSTGKGTQEAPYASLTKALAVIPKDLGGLTIKINVAAGTYAESNVTIDGFYGGTLEIAGESTTTQTFSNRIIGSNNQCRLVMRYITATAQSTGAAFSFSRCFNVELEGCKAVASTGGGQYGVYSSFLSRVYANNVEINNCSYALACAWGELYTSTMTGSGNTYGATATKGGRIGVGGTMPGYTTAEFVTSSGGRIYRDGQANVPIY